MNLTHPYKESITVVSDTVVFDIVLSDMMCTTILHTKRLVCCTRNSFLAFRTVCELRLVSCLQTCIMIAFWYDFYA